MIWLYVRTDFKLCRVLGAYIGPLAPHNSNEYPHTFKCIHPTLSAIVYVRVKNTTNLHTTMKHKLFKPIKHEQMQLTYRMYT